MDIVNLISSEILNHRRKTGKSPNKLTLTKVSYQELKDAVEKDLGHKLDAEMTYYYGIPLEVTNGKNYKIEVS